MSSKNNPGRGVEIVRVAADDLSSTVRLFTDFVYRGDAAAARQHLADHAGGLGDTFLAWSAGEWAGYVTIRWQSHNENFRQAGIPLIHDLLVFERFRRQGIASRLMDAAESWVAARAHIVGITVGLFDTYGPAQRLYAQRGYVPDGRGVCHRHRPLVWGETVRMDHDLILWLTKQLSP